MGALFPSRRAVITADVDLRREHAQFGCVDTDPRRRTRAEVSRLLSLQLHGDGRAQLRSRQGRGADLVGRADLVTLVGDLTEPRAAAAASAALDAEDLTAGAGR